MKHSVAAINTPIVSYSEIKTYLRRSDDTHQTELTDLIAAATDHAEMYLDAVIAQRAVTATYYDGEALQLPRGPVNSITSITDHDNAVYTSYDLEVVGNIETLTVTSGNPVYPVVVVYSAGFSTVPQSIKLWIKQTVAQWFENKSPIVVGTTAGELPVSGLHLLNLHRRNPFVG